MSDQDGQDPKGEAKGEGSYEGTRDYNKRTETFLDQKGEKVEDLARDAARALDSDEGVELEQAEEQGKAKAKS